jgi:hypothetical protein
VLACLSLPQSPQKLTQITSPASAPFAHTAKVWGGRDAIELRFDLPQRTLLFTICDM